MHDPPGLEVGDDLLDDIADLVDLIDLTGVPELPIDETRADVQRLSDNPFQVRVGIVDRLIQAQTRLPDGYQMQLKEGWRPIWVQQHLWERHLSRLRARRPDLAEEQLVRENARYVAPPDTAPPHSTGAAVDVVLLHRGVPADMGWGFNQPGHGSRTAAPVAPTARRHRDLLTQVMHAAGFINYPAEWWHWSYGDRYWAFQTGHGAASYGPC